MFLKQLLPFLCCMLFGIVQAQKVEINKNDILLDGKPLLKYEKINLATFSIKDLNGEEILFYQIKHNGTDSSDDDYLSFNFVTMKKKIQTSSVARIVAFGTKNMVEKMLRWLISDGVFKPDGSIDANKLDIFYEKYNDIN
jgi:hypothetical protein